MFDVINIIDVHSLEKRFYLKYRLIFLVSYTSLMIFEDLSKNFKISFNPRILGLEDCRL
jgi:hypothetical protein